MKKLLLIPFLFAVVGYILIQFSNRVPAPLPHRAVTELTNWGQGRNPGGGGCPPGTIRFDTDEGLFLECYRGTH